MSVTTAETSEYVDALFAPWSRADSPGCVVAVFEDGAVAWQQAYGMADLTHQVPITAATVFHVASLSKQFTAATVFLLEQRARLSLDEDVREYLPELSALPVRVRVRELLYHTSGLRDQWALLELAGWRYGHDLITESDVLQLVARQRGLNFPPGERFAYSNTGYTLLAAIVARVSSMTFAEFTRREIFEPLGMRQSHFRDEYAAVIPAAACGYEWDPHRQRYRIRQAQFETVGATSLQTTVLDLARWEANFHQPRVGGPELVQRLVAPGTLRDGTPLEYAGGLICGSYRGVPTVRHGGADAGFRAELVRFPRERCAVALLANAANIAATPLACRVADWRLGDRLTSGPSAVPRMVVVPGRTDVSAPVDVAGVYWHREEDHFMKVVVSADSVAVRVSGQTVPLTPVDERTFVCVDEAEQDRITLRFEQAPDGTTGALCVDFLNSGKQIVYETRQEPDAVDAAEYAGRYASDEVSSVHQVEVTEQGGLAWRRPRHAPLPLDRVGRDVFACALGTVRFQRDARARVHAFVFSAARVRNLVFTRVALRHRRTIVTVPWLASAAPQGAEAR